MLAHTQVITVPTVFQSTYSTKNFQSLFSVCQWLQGGELPLLKGW